MSNKKEFTREEIETILDEAWVEAKHSEYLEAAEMYANILNKKF